VKQLFLFYIGGEAPGANIEVHDVQFVAAESPQQAFPRLIERWYGIPSSLHIDTYTRVTWADGYDVALAAEQPKDDEKLWFLNIGGYRPGHIAELHACGLFIARSQAEAKKRAKKSLLTGAVLQHTDDQVDVDDCIHLADVDGLHVHLTPNPHGSADGQPEFQGYLRLAD
jgi:hypothetical protein